MQEGAPKTNVVIYSMEVRGGGWCQYESLYHTVVFTRMCPKVSYELAHTDAPSDNAITALSTAGAGQT